MNNTIAAVIISGVIIACVKPDKYIAGCSGTCMYYTIFADNIRRNSLDVPNEEIRCFICAAIHSLGDYDEWKQSRKNSGNRSDGCSGYDIYSAELPFHFWLAINMRDFVERYSQPGSYNYSNDREEGVYIHTMQYYRLNDYGKVHSFV